MEETPEGLALAAQTREVLKSKKRQLETVRGLDARRGGRPRFLLHGTDWRAGGRWAGCPPPLQAAAATPVPKRAGRPPPTCTHEVAVPHDYVGDELDPELHGEGGCAAADC